MYVMEQVTPRATVSTEVSVVHVEGRTRDPRGELRLDDVAQRDHAAAGQRAHLAEQRRPLARIAVETAG